MGEDSTDWNRLLDPQSGDANIGDALEMFAEMVATYYKNLLAKDVPEGKATLLTAEFQSGMISGMVSKWGAE